MSEDSLVWRTHTYLVSEVLWCVLSVSVVAGSKGDTEMFLVIPIPQRVTLFEIRVVADTFSLVTVTS